MDWPELKQMVKTCTACALHKTRKQTVFGVGDENADWLFVGEGPGAEEDARGEPFVGQAGQAARQYAGRHRAQARRGCVHCQRREVPASGQPHARAGRGGACEPYLLRQIELIRPS